MVANAKISLSPQVQLKKHAVLPHSIQAKLDSHNNKNQVSFPLHYFLSLHKNINNPTIFYNLISILFYKKITSPPTLPVITHGYNRHPNLMPSISLQQNLSKTIPPGY